MLRFLSKKGECLLARFFVTASNIFGGIAYLSSEDAGHIKALRIRNGETFTVCDGNGTDYSCVLTKMDDGGAEAEILEKTPSVGEPDVQCTVFMAWAKGDKNEHVVQKAVELGAKQIVLFPCSRCVSRPDEKTVVKKLLRLCKIAEEAAKQCGRGTIPTVTAFDNYDAAIREAAQADLALFCYEDEKETGMKQTLEAAGEVKTVSVVTGPEGGFEPGEAEFAALCGMKSVTMGKRILRCETAPLCALTAVMYHTGNL